MKLLERQIFATRATLNQVLQEYAEGEDRHHWKCDRCPFCIELDTDDLRCRDCPLWRFECVGIKRRDFEGHATLPEIAGFLWGMLISLEQTK